MENEDLVRQFVQRQKGKVEVMEVEMSVGEPTECGIGWRILPDTSPMREGPLFVAKLRRVG